MYEPLAFEHFNERFQLEVAPGRDQILVSFCERRAILLPRPLIIASADERVANHLLNAHPCSGVAACLALWIKAGSFGVFTKGKLDSRRCAREDEVLDSAAIFQLDHGILSSDSVT